MELDDAECLARWLVVFDGERDHRRIVYIPNRMDMVTHFVNVLRREARMEVAIELRQAIEDCAKRQCV